MRFRYYQNNNDLYASEMLVEDEIELLCTNSHHKMNLRQSSSTPYIPHQHQTHIAHQHQTHIPHQHQTHIPHQHQTQIPHQHQTHIPHQHQTQIPHQHEMTNKINRDEHVKQTNNNAGHVLKGNVQHPHHTQESKLHQQTAEKLDREQEKKRTDIIQRINPVKPNFLDCELQNLSAMIGVPDYSRQGRHLSKMKTSGTADENKIQLLFDTIEEYTATNKNIFRKSKKTYIDKFHRILRSIESPEKIHEYVPAIPGYYKNIIGSAIVSQFDECFFELMDLRKTSSKKFNIEIRCIKEVRFQEMDGGEWIKNETPLELAVRSKRPEYVQSLVDAGVNTSAMTEQKVDEIFDYEWPRAVDTKPTLLRCFNYNKKKLSAADNAKVLFGKNNTIRKILGLALKSSI